MFKPAKAAKEYFDAFPEERKKTMMFLRKFIQKTAPKLTSNFLYTMLGYGTFKYKSSYQKEKLDWTVIGLASQKNYISLYVCER
jgi:hypothetical protein